MPVVMDDTTEAGWSPKAASGFAAMGRVLAHMRGTGDFDEAKVKRDGKGRFSNTSSKKVEALSELSEKQRQALLDKYGEALFESSSLDDYLSSLPKGQDPEGTRVELEMDLRTMEAEFTATASSFGAKYIGPEYDPEKRYKAPTKFDFGHAAPLDRFIASMQEVDEEADALQFGIKGMKWGVRRSEKQLEAARADADPDAIKAVETQTKINAAGSLNVVSSKDLQQLVSRMELEKKYIKATLESSATTQKGSSLLGKAMGLLGREFTMKASGKDGPLLLGYKALKATRDKQVGDALIKANRARAAKAEQDRLRKTQQERERQAAYNSPSNKRRHPGPYTTADNPARRRTERAERVYNVTTLNTQGNPLSLPRGRG